MTTSSSLQLSESFLLGPHSITQNCHRETSLPEVNTEVKASVQPPQLPLSVAHVQSKASEKTESHHVREDHPKQPDLSRVLYRETYDEYTRERRPVVLTSHYWSSQQSLFVGCRGGQLLSTDFDTAIIQVLANPRLAQV